VSTTLSNIVSGALSELLPQVRVLFAEMEATIKPLLEERRALSSATDHDGEVRLFDGSIATKKTVDVHGLSVLGNPVSLTEASAAQGLVQLDCGGRQWSLKFVGEGRGDLLERELIDGLGPLGDWVQDIGSAMNRRYLPFVPTTAFVNAMSDMFDQRALLLAKSVSTFEEEFDDFRFAALLERLRVNPDFETLFAQVQHFPTDHPQSCSPYLGHIQGLPMSSKSKLFVSFLTVDDIVVCPSKKLALSWHAMFADVPRAKRPRILTQHMALLSTAARYVIVDESYTLPMLHVAALAKCAVQGIITIGDPTQIRVQLMNFLRCLILLIYPLRFSLRLFLLFLRMLWLLICRLLLQRFCQIFLLFWFRVIVCIQCRMLCRVRCWIMVMRRWWVSRKARSWCIALVILVCVRHMNIRALELTL
jgi:hypothetical protein